jgi:hypothetical protein
VGRTGGGLAEMKAYSVVDQLPTIINICASAQSQCGLSNEQKNDLNQLSQRIELKNVGLVAPWSGPTKFSNMQLSLNSQDLYKNGLPKSYGEILSLSLYLLLRDGLKLSETSARWPYLVFPYFQENMRSLEIFNFGYKLHSLSLAMPNSQFKMLQALALEKEKTTEDLSQNLVELLGCSDPIWSIETWTYLLDQSWVRAQLLWFCDGHEYSGELQLKVNSLGVDRIGIVRKNRIR